MLNTVKWIKLDQIKTYGSFGVSVCEADRTLYGIKSMREERKCFLK